MTASRECRREGRWVRDANRRTSDEEERNVPNADDAKEALERDWEQTKSDMPGLEGKDLDQDVSDTIKQAVGKDESNS